MASAAGQSDRPASRPAPELDRTALKALARPSDRKGLRHLTVHLALLGLTGALVLAAGKGPWLPPALVVHGIVLSFLFAPLHETIHRTAFKSRRLNDLVAVFCGALLLLPARYFRAFHLTHHRFTQDPARDPERAAPPLSSRAGYLLKVSGLPYWAERALTTWRHATGRITEPFLPAQLRGAIRREAQGHLLLYAAVAAAGLLAGTALPLWLWVIPALLGQPFLRLFLLAEHTGCPEVPDMLANSRTTETNRWVELLCWNMNRHTAHHAYPAVPFHALPAADRLLAPAIAVRTRGYVTLQREVWQSLAAGR